MRARRHRSHGARRSLLALAVAACAGGVVFWLQTLSPEAANATNPSNPTGATENGGRPASNPPNELALAGGTPQTAQLDTAFVGSLQVTLANTNGCPVTGVVGTPITFTTPPSGPSGTFQASGSDILTIGADAQGAAQAGRFTANHTPGSYTVSATSAYGTVSFALTNSAAGLPAAITPLAPASRSARVETRYAKPLAVRVTDASGTPVVGASVTFSLATASAGAAGGRAGVAAAGASFAGGSPRTTETTNSDGIASSPSITANDTSGTFTASASVAHVTDPASFRLRNLAAVALRLRRVGHWQRTTTIDTSYRRPLQVRVSDAGGPVAGKTVSFTLGSTGASGGSSAGAQFTTGSAHATATTGRRGLATSPRFAANAVAGTLTATVTLQGTGQSARFRLDDHAGAPVKVSAGVAARESTILGAAFAIPLAVMVTDAHDNPAPGAPVTFTAPASGASGSFHGRRSVTVPTDTRGVAVAPSFTANDVAGGYVVTATTGHTRAAAFALVNQQP